MQTEAKVKTALNRAAKGQPPRNERFNTKKGSKQDGKEQNGRRNKTAGETRGTARPGGGAYCSTKHGVDDVQIKATRGNKSATTDVIQRHKLN